MREPTLVKSLTNVKPVTSVSAKAGTLRIHERTHSGEKRHKCKTCDKCFSQAGTLRIRERTTLVNNLTNAKPVTSVSAKQEL